MTMSFNRHIVFHLAVMLLLPLFASCYNYYAEESQVIADSTLVDNTYLEFTVSINNGNVAGTRAPIGGEIGDGRETGFERENIVSGITVIFYQDDSGINTASTTTKIDYVKYYPVAFVSRESSGGSEDIEAKYTTGEQRFPKDNLDISKKYHIIVVANANLTGEVEKGNLLSDVRKKTRSKLYDGTGIGVNATNFVMSSEKDYELNFPGTSPAISGVNPVKQVYNFDNIIIERLAARIDFSTKYSTLDKVNYDATNYDRAGYVYRVWNAADEAANTAPSNAEDANRDHFVVVSITPFNVSDGNTYLIKRIADDGKTPSDASNVTSTFAKRTAAAYVPRYLDGETTTSWVLDSYSSAAKNAEAYPSHIKGTLDAYKTQTSLASSPYNLELKKAWHDVASNYFDLDGNETFIVSYPKENTVDSDSPLYYYATGVAIEGIYYTKGTTTGGTPKVYYGFLRHQGESDAAYDAFKLEGKDAAETTSLITAAKAMKCNSSKAMNFSVVRNNIYRISIDRITEQGTLELKIKVKKWDPYIHEYIYM